MTASVRLELVVAEDGPPSHLADRLDQLCATGAIDGYDAQVVPPDDDETLARFHQWATANGVAFRADVTAETAESGFSDEALRLPAVALAEYHDGDLRFVAPCQDRETVYTVLDRLRELGRVRR